MPAQRISLFGRAADRTGRRALQTLVQRWDPLPLTAIGLGGLLVIIALMVLKSF